MGSCYPANLLHWEHCQWSGIKVAHFNDWVTAQRTTKHNSSWCTHLTALAVSTEDPGLGSKNLCLLLGNFPDLTWLIWSPLPWQDISFDVILCSHQNNWDVKQNSIFLFQNKAQSAWIILSFLWEREFSPAPSSKHSTWPGSLQSFTWLFRSIWSNSWTQSAPEICVFWDRLWWASEPASSLPVPHWQEAVLLSSAAESFQMIMWQQNHVPDFHSFLKLYMIVTNILIFFPSWYQRCILLRFCVWQLE